MDHTKIPKSNGASNKRRAKIAAIRAEVQMREQQELDSIKRKIAHTPPGEPVTLWESEAHTLMRAADRAPRNVGAPTQLEVFQTWMAAHYLWRRSQHDKASVADATVCAAWGVSKTAIVEAIKDHKSAATRLVRTLGDDAAAYANFALMADAFRKLGE